MGTAKRERQKANRQQRLQEIARAQRKEKTKRRGLLIGGVVVGGLVLLFLLARLFGGDDSSSSSTATTTATTLDPTATTLDPSASTTEAPSTTEGATTTEGPTTTEAPTTTVAEDFAYGTAPCPKDDGSSTTPDSFEGAPKLCIDPAATYTAEVTTNKGAFTITLDAERSPGNVNNFVTLARYHYYDGTGCHRVIANFVVQCGRPGEDESAPGYTVPDELPSDGEYQVGMVVMANTGTADTGGGQWFVITGADGASLPPQYSIIGTVTKGMDSTVKALANLADPTASNGVPPLVPIEISKVEITES